MQRINLFRVSFSDDDDNCINDNYNDNHIDSSDVYDDDNGRDNDDYNNDDNNNNGNNFDDDDDNVAAEGSKSAKCATILKGTDLLEAKWTLEGLSCRRCIDTHSTPAAAAATPAAIWSTSTLKNIP